MPYGKNQVQGTTKIIHDYDAGRNFSNGQVDQTIHHLINLKRSSKEKQGESHSSQGSHNLNISGRPARKDSRDSRPAPVDHNICLCDEIVQNACKLGSKPFCLCEDDSSSAQMKPSSLRIQIPKFNNKGAHGSKLRQGLENKLRKPAEDVQNRRTPAPNPQHQISRDLTALPSENIPFLGRPVKFRDQSFPIEDDDSVVLPVLNPPLNDVENSKQHSRSKTTNQFDNPTKSSSERPKEAIHLPRTFLGFGPVNEMTGNWYSSPSYTASVSGDNSTPSLHDSLPIRRQRTMECVTYPKFFSMFNGFQLTTGFTGDKQESPSLSKISGVNSVVSLHSEVTDPRDPSSIEVSEASKEDNNKIKSQDFSPLPNWMIFAFAAAFIWLAFLTYQAIKSKETHGFFRKSSTLLNDYIYGKYDGQIG